MSDDAPYTRLALFGATGQIGASILNALLHPSFPGYEPHIKVFLRDESYGKKASTIPDHPRVEKVKADFDNVEELAEKLKGVEAVVSALNGPGIDAQYKILDACAEAGVKRFLPSEYGSEHPWRKPGDEWTHTHPYFDIKARFKEYMYLHPAMVSGKMTYTIVGVGDLYDQPTENYWIAWAQQKLPDTYVFPVVADPSSKYEITSIQDMAQYIAALLARPSLSKDSHLNFVSDVVSQQEIADMLKEVTGKEVKPDYVTEEQAHGYIANPATIPERAKQSRFAADFWYIVRLQQGTNNFRRHPSLIHNDRFPEIKTTPLRQYLQGIVAQNKAEQ
ncbi:hypothetical protein NBRC10513v2_005259 [Rhodotorula toruloides]|uniref:BY PROTMAP: gi/647399713/emb/CDR44655.1/ RHTO0S09e07404g1_1 [Rhodosporidium toruloides] n=1 Tax=Rhodotorula toruloides TaxID=5286 RepID=A0A0K3CMI4_RHOTO|nr:hypothetical protein AAT19DRAFT_9738 [Rhodotorula toruloides]